MAVEIGDIATWTGIMISLGWQIYTYFSSKIKEKALRKQAANEKIKNELNKLFLLSTEYWSKVEEDTSSIGFAITATLLSIANLIKNNKNILYNNIDTDIKVLRRVIMKSDFQTKQRRSFSPDSQFMISIRTNIYDIFDRL